MSCIALILYNILFPILFILYLPLFIIKLVKRGDFKKGFGERFGLFSAEKKSALSNMRSPVWIHAVSVGETVAALSFIKQWNKKEPGLQFVVSTTTSTGQKIAREQAPENVVSVYFPIDFFACGLSSLNTIKPHMLIIFEVEIWPSLIALAAWKKTPLALVNCRMSDRSARGYSRHRWFFNYIFSRFSLICTQTEDDSLRIKSITGEQSNIKVCNTMKFDQVKDSQNENMGLLINSLFPEPDRMIFIAASTHPGEEEIMIKAYQSLAIEFPSICLIIAPRHAERSNEVEKILEKKDIDYVLFKELKKSILYSCDAVDGNKIDGSKKRKVLLVNTTGELMNIFPVADIVFMGKSLAGNKGGHNIIEPAIYGKPIIYGNNMDNFRQVSEIFKENKAAVEVGNEEEFFEELRRLLTDKSERERIGNAAREVVEKNRGAISKTIDLLMEIIR